MRRIGRWIAAPFRLAWLLIAFLFRTLAEILRVLRWIAFYVARFIGGGAGAVTFGIILGMYFVAHEPTGSMDDGPIFFAVVAVGVICRMFWRLLEPGPRRVRPPKAAKAAPMPVVSGSGRRTDDPSEAAIIARLPANLRALLAGPKRPVQQQDG